MSFLVRYFPAIVFPLPKVREREREREREKTPIATSELQPPSEEDAEDTWVF
jgi:hypothetical protein